MSNHDLTPKQRLFVSGRLSGLSQADAYKQAGYLVKSTAVADAAATRLLSNVKVAAAIEDALRAREARTLITADRVLTELARLGFSDMRDYAMWGPHGVTLKHSDELTTDQARAVIQVSEHRTVKTQFNKDGDVVGETVQSNVTFKLADKEGALDKIAKHLRMYPKEGGLEINDAQEVKLLIINADRDSD